MLEALIFDVDGTLADTERDGHRQAFNDAFAEAGLDWHWDEARYGELLVVTGGRERIRHFCERYAQQFLRGDDARARIGALHAAKTRHYLARLAAGRIALRPGVARLLHEAHAAGVRLAIATTTTRANVAALLPAGLMALFETVGAGDTAARKKPAPDIYLWVLRQLGLPSTACLAIEDSVPGLRAALAAGVPTVVVESDYSRGHDFAGAAAVLSGLGDPGHPCALRGAGGRGDLGARPAVDLAALRDWHRQAIRSP